MFCKKGFKRKVREEKLRKDRREESFYVHFVENFAPFAVKLYLLNIRYINIVRTICILLFLLLLYPSSAYSQKKNIDTVNIENDDIIEKIESIAEQSDAELDYTDLLENQNYYQAHPINLNNTTLEELEKLMILNDIQINNLLDHIKSNGKLLSLYELQSISGFDLVTIRKLLPYVYVSNAIGSRHFSLKEMLDNSHNQLIHRYQQILEQEQGFAPITDSARAASPNSRYLGSPEALYAKYSFTYYNNINIGFTADKSTGEQFFKSTEKNGFDYYSAHAYFKNFGVIKALAIGDYQAQFGQGLTLWTGLGFGKSSDGTFIKKSASGITPYTSVTDNLFMRGIGTTIGIKDFEFSTFYSRKKIDANITASDSSTGEVLYISSLQQTGIHATPSEIADKDAISETAIGGHVCYKTNRINIGATAFKSEYSAILQRQLQLYNQFEFNGKENTNLGIDYSYIFKNINFFGEAARSENNAKALLAGMLMSLDQNVTMSVLYRNYDKSYQALYSSAFAESSTPANEKGLFTGILLKPFRSITVNAYIDNMSFPWLKYRVDAPSNAIDYLVQLNWDPSKKLEMYVRYRQTDKELNDPEISSIINVPSKTLKQNYRFNTSYNISSSVTLKDRVELTRYIMGNGTPQIGYILYQDINYKKMRSPLSFSFRYAIFDADTYDSRIYAFENEVLGGYSVPALYNKGIRYYITTRYSINRQFDVWLRFSQTDYSNINTISSGLTQINGQIKSEVEAQLRIRF
jgi:DNA uptake protein ComE-like DNA-binding protein